MPRATPPEAGCRSWVERLRHEAATHPARCAFVFLARGEGETDRLSYGELDAKARAIAVELTARMPVGSRVLLLYPSGLEFIAALFGCLYAGMIAVPSYPSRARHRSAERLQRIVADADATLALTDSATLSRLQPELAASPGLVHVVLAATDSMGAGTAADWREPSIGPDTIAILQYTSGSTARPRGVVLTHRALLHNAEVIRHAFATSVDQTNVSWLPLHHDMGLIGNVLGSMYMGGRGVLMPPEAFLMKPERWLRAISRYRARSSGAPNFAYALCVERISDEQRATLDLAHWELAYCGAEPVRARTLQRFADAFAPCGFRREALYPCYGLAEATLLVTGGPAGRPPVVTSFAGGALRDRRALAVADDADDARALVSCGGPWNGQRVIIVDPDTRRTCLPDRIGEICVAGGSVASGYWRQPAATAETFGLVLAETQDGPWLRTGDLGFIHDGELYVSGRSKDLIIVAGRNHFAEDIELTVEQAHRAVSPHGAAAISVDADDGERVVVVAEVERHFLTHWRDGGDRPAAAGDEIRRAIRAAVAERNELPLQAVHLVRPATIPRTSSGKIQRQATRAAYAAGTLRAIDEGPQTSMHTGTAHAG